MYKDYYKQDVDEFINNITSIKLDGCHTCCEYLKLTISTNAIKNVGTVHLWDVADFNINMYPWYASLVLDSVSNLYWFHDVGLLHDMYDIDGNPLKINNYSICVAFNELSNNNNNVSSINESSNNDKKGILYEGMAGCHSDILIHKGLRDLASRMNVFKNQSGIQTIQLQHRTYIHIQDLDHEFIDVKFNTYPRSFRFNLYVIFYAFVCLFVFSRCVKSSMK